MNKFRKSLPPLSSLLPFEATARLGSVTRAADELGLTQAAVSRQIRALEDDLGVALFNRRNRAVFLNESGTQLNQSIASALDTLSTAAISLRQRQAGNAVFLFAQLCEGLYWLMPNLSRFYQQYQTTEVKVSVSTLPLTQATDYFDIALQTTGRESGDFERLFSVADEVFPVCSPAYAARFDPPLSIEYLHDYHLLHHKVYPQDWIDWDDWLQRLGVDKRVGFKGSVFDSYPMMIQSAIEGHGIALGWKQTTKRLLSDGQLMRPFKQSLPLPDGLSVYLHPGCQRRAALDQFIDWLHRELQCD